MRNWTDHLRVTTRAEHNAKSCVFKCFHTRPSLYFAAPLMGLFLLSFDSCMIMDNVEVSPQTIGLCPQASLILLTCDRYAYHR